MTSTLKDRLKLAMESASPQVTQADLARACGVKPPSVSEWTSGKTKKLAGMNGIRAAQRLGVTPEWLMTGKGAMRPGQATADKRDSSVGDRSQSIGLDPAILSEAETWATIIETAAGRPLTRTERTVRVASIYDRIVSDGGRLSDENHRAFLQEIEAAIKSRGTSDAHTPEGGN